MIQHLFVAVRLERHPQIQEQVDGAPRVKRRKIRRVQLNLRDVRERLQHFLLNLQRLLMRQIIIL